MSRGLSKIQRVVLGLLDGTERGMVYQSTTALDTGEMLDELVERGMVKDGNRKLAMFTVRRACDSLLSRGLISGKNVFDSNNPGRRTICWSKKEAN